MSDWFLVAKWAHILGSTVLFGTGIGIAFFFWSAWRTGDAATVARVGRLVVRADWIFTLPSGLLQPITGAWLIVLRGYDPWEPWLVASYAAYALALACWLPVVMLQIRIRDLADQAQARGDPLPAAARRLFRAWFALGWPAFIALLGVFALMIARPM